MNFLRLEKIKKLKNTAKKFCGYSFSLTSAFAILKSDLITEKICDFLERKCRTHISNPMNSKDLLDEELYIKDIVRKKK